VSYAAILRDLNIWKLSLLPDLCTAFEELKRS